MRKLLLLCFVLVSLSSCDKDTPPELPVMINVSGSWTIPDDPNNATLLLHDDRYRYYSDTDKLLLEGELSVLSKADGFHMYMSGIRGPLSFFIDFAASTVSKLEDGSLRLVSEANGKTIILTRE